VPLRFGFIAESTQAERRYSGTNPSWFRHSSASEAAQMINRSSAREKLGGTSLQLCSMDQILQKARLRFEKIREFWANSSQSFGGLTALDNGSMHFTQGRTRALLLLTPFNSLRLYNQAHAQSHPVRMSELRRKHAQDSRQTPKRS
jgi:hypothetical protein